LRWYSTRLMRGRQARAILAPTCSAGGDEKSANGALRSPNSPLEPAIVR
jgi:hypothetical protein